MTWRAIADHRAADLHIENRRLRAELDAALAVIATLSARLQDAERREFAATQRARSVAAVSFPSTDDESGFSQPHPYGVVLPAGRIFKLGGERFQIAVRKLGRKTRVGFEIVPVEFDTFNAVGNPHADVTVGDGVAREHEVDVSTEQLVHFQVRLVSEPERPVADVEPAPEVTHDEHATDASSTTEDDAA